MSEIKRVALNTLEPQKVSDKATKKQCKTLRISVILPESNEDICPEYNYKDQLAAVKKKSRQVKDPNHVESVENGLDHFGETDDDVRRIALEMEAKYGTGMTDCKKKRKGRKDDYADIGMGYDESDSFIDNTDGYDEIIPQNVTTLHGGFYINCGALEFKTDDEASSQISSSSSSSEDEDGNQTKTNRKRILDTSADSDSESAATSSHNKKKPKIQSPKHTMQQAIKKKLFSANKIQVKKRRPIDPLKKTVKDLLREKREDLNMTVPAELKEIEENMEKDSLKENKVPMSITSVTDAIESVLKQVVEEEEKFVKNQDVDGDRKSPPSISNNVAENSQPQPMETESSQELVKSEKQEPVKLPENLPSDIIQKVEKIRDAALNYKGDGKKAFFTDEVNSFLLSLERKCKVLGKSSRLRVYEHLCGFVKCRKETLIKRAKNLVLEDEERRLKMMTVKLKDTIDYMMPSLLVVYEQESQKVLEKKFSKESANSEENKSLKMPRRKFQWTEEAKRLIKDILSIKKRCLLLEGKQKDKLEEQVVDYLRTVILPLWPEGWMYLNNLKKVYNSMSESSKSINKSSTSNSNKSKHSTSDNSLATSTKVYNSSVGTLGSEVELFDSKLSLNTTSTSCRAAKENDKSRADPPNNSSYSGKTEISKCVDENNVFKPYAEKYPKSSPQYPKTTSPQIDEPADLSTNSKYSDMFKPYVSGVELSKQSKPSEVFKLYSEKSSYTIVQESIFPNVDRISPKAEKVSPQTDKFVAYAEKYLPHTDIVSSHADKVSSFAGNYATHAENLSTHAESYVQEKLVSHSEALSTAHPEYAENRSIRKENAVLYPEKSILTLRPSHEEKRVAHVEKPQVNEESLYVEKAQVTEKPLFIEKRQFAENSTHLETVRITEKPHVEKPRSSDKLRYEEKSRYAERSHAEKPRHMEKPQHSEKHRHSEKTAHIEKTRHLDKYHGVESILTHPEKYISRAEKHSNRERVPVHSEKLTSHTDFPSLSAKVPYDEKPSDFSKHFRQSDLFKSVESPKDFSKYEMFKPYAETPRSHSGDFPKHHRSKEHYRPNDVLKSPSEKSVMKEMSPSRHGSLNDIPSSSKHSRSNDNSSTPKHSRSNDKHRLGDLPAMLDDGGVIVKNTHQSKEESRKLPREDRNDHSAVISKVSHCQVSEMKKKLTDPRTPDLFADARPSDYFSKASNKLLDYHSSTPVKSEGDDIQMVMENLKALQKLSCSPVKNDNSPSSPVSVIAYNKNFSSSKSSSGQKGDSNSNKGDLSGGFQDEFQKQFINSLQQMAANSSTTKSSYNRCS